MWKHYLFWDCRFQTYLFARLPISFCQGYLYNNVHMRSCYVQNCTKLCVFKCERWNNTAILKTKYKINKAGNQTYIASPLFRGNTFDVPKNVRFDTPLSFKFPIFVCIFDTNKHNCTYMKYDIVLILLFIFQRAAEWIFARWTGRQQDTCLLTHVAWQNARGFFKIQ